MEYLVLHRRVLSPNAVPEHLDNVAHGRADPVQRFFEAPRTKANCRAHGAPGTDHWPVEGADQWTPVLRDQPGGARVGRADREVGCQIHWFGREHLPIDSVVVDYACPVLR